MLREGENAWRLALQQLERQLQSEEPCDGGKRQQGRQSEQGKGPKTSISKANLKAARVATHLGTIRVISQSSSCTSGWVCGA